MTYEDEDLEREYDWVPEAASRNSLDIAREVAEHHSARRTYDGLLVDAQTANLFVQIHEKLKPENAAKLAAMEPMRAFTIAWKLVA